VTEIRRLLDGGEINEFERWLVQSAANERPGSVLSSQMRTGLGLSAVSVGARISGISSLKLTLLAVTLGTLMGVHSTENAPIHPAMVQVSATSQLAQEPLRDTREGIAATTESPVNEPATLTTPVLLDSTLSLTENKVTRVRERTRLAERSRSTSGPDLREEIRLLDLARTAIQRQQPEEALASIKIYNNRFSAGSFKQEASVLRMQALAQIGDMSRASSMAKQFVESNPNSPYVGHASRIAKRSPSSDALR
jgi:hypothetical protein